jgi:hypothetical protein
MWDYGVKHGDIQALGAFSYTEPFIGAILAALATGTALSLDLLWPGFLIVGGAAIASSSLWRSQEVAVPPEQATGAAAFAPPELVASAPQPERLALLGNRELERIVELGSSETALSLHESELKVQIAALRSILQQWDEILKRDSESKAPLQPAKVRTVA